MRTRRVFVVLFLAGIGLGAPILVVALGSWPERVGYEVYAPGAGAWEDLRGRKADWRRQLTGVVRIRDLRDHSSKERCYTLDGPNVDVCDSMEGATGMRGRLANAEMRSEAPVEKLLPFASCAVERVPFLPAGNVRAEMEVRIGPDGNVTSLRSDSSVFAGLRQCAEATARSYREREGHPGIVQISASLWYRGWCTELPSGQRPVPSGGWVSRGGLKGGGTEFVLHLADFGYWLTWCTRPETRQVRVGDRVVEVVEQSGAVVSRAQRTAHGFTVTDAAGNVVLSAAGAPHRFELFVGKRSVGSLTRTVQPGAPPVVTFAMPNQEPLRVERDDASRWVLRHDLGTLVLDRQGVPDALPLLTPEYLGGHPPALDYQVAAFALLSNWQK